MNAAGEGVGVEIVLELELAEEETPAAVALFVARHAERAAGAHRLVGRERVGLVEQIADTFEKLLLGGGGIERAERFRLLELSIFPEAGDVLGIEREDAVIVFGITTLSVTGDHLGKDFVLENQFFGGGAHERALEQGARHFASKEFSSRRTA